MKAEIIIDNDVILDGEGNLTVDANDAHRVFSVASRVTADLRGMTIMGGSISGVNGNGGGIYNPSGSVLSVSNSIVAGNSASEGGGIFSWGTLTVTNSMVSGNAAYYGGGGVSNGGDGTLTNSTVSGNSAEFSGGGISNGGVLRATNSTVSGNSTRNTGGGVVTSGTLTLTNSAESEAAGIYNNEGEVTPMRSLVEGDCRGTIISGGYNIESPGDTCRLDPDGTDLVDVPDPMLGPLLDNGGLTMTHALLPGSPAINRIPAEACEVDTDQRGEPRPETGGTMCDVGAFEVQP